MERIILGCVYGLIDDRANHRWTHGRPHRMAELLVAQRRCHCTIYRAWHLWLS